MNKARTVRTAENFENKFINILPKAVILHALGGYSAGMEDKAEDVVKALWKYMSRNEMVIMPSLKNKGSVKFVPLNVLLNAKKDTK